MWWAYTRGGLYSGGLIVGGLRYIHDLPEVAHVIYARRLATSFPGTEDWEL